MFLPLIGLTFLLVSDLAKGNLSESTLVHLTSLAMILGASLITLLGVFFALINKEYRHTFFSFETGGQMTRRNFLEGDEVMKAEVFDNNKFHWSPIRDKVAAWVKEGWATWEEEKPDWFTDRWRDSVPEDMIPMKSNTASEREKDESGRAGEQERKGRRKSISQILGGAKTPKVSPEDGVEEKLDEDEFVRQLKRR